MKVLTKKTWSKKYKCQDCGSKLEVEASDIKIRNDACFWGGETYEPRWYFKCPECKVVNDVNEHSLPAHVRDGARLPKS